MGNTTKRVGDWHTVLRYEGGEGVTLRVQSETQSEANLIF